MLRPPFYLLIALGFFMPLKGISSNKPSFLHLFPTFSLSGGVIGADQTICAGSTPATLFNIAAASGGVAPVTYQWQSSSDGIVFTNMASASGINYSPGALNATLFFRRRVSDGTAEAFSNVVKITVNTIPATPSITALSSTSFCAGDTVVLRSTEAGTYQWFRNGQLIDGAVSRTFSATLSGSYAVAVQNAGGCASTSASTSVIANPLPPVPVISAGSATRFCQGEHVVLTAPSASAYQWYRDGQVIAVATDRSLTATVSGVFKVEVTNQFGCTHTSSSTKVTVDPLPDQPMITAGGPTTFCSTDSVVLTASSGATHQWLRDGVAISNASGASFVATAAADFSVKVKNAFGCESVASNVVKITTRPAPADPVVTAGGPLAFCEGGTVVLTSSPGTTYRWLKDGVSVVDAASQSFTASATGNYAVIVSNAQGCNSRPSAISLVTVNLIPARPSITASGPLVFCAGGSVQLRSSAAAAYQWLRDGQELTGTVSQTVNITETGSYAVLVRSAAGCVSAVSSATSVTVNPVPAAPAVIIGAARVLAGATETYTVAAVSGAIGYTWTLPSGWSGTSMTNSITVRVGTAAGSITVRAITPTCSSGVTSLSVSILPDNDKDNIADEDDLDDDNDGIPDLIEASACSPTTMNCDTDGDGIPNRFDLDSDGDRIPDVWEAGGRDDNNDGIADGTVSAQGLPTSAAAGLMPPDTDRDGRLDPYDVDSNNDGIPDGETLLLWKTVRSPRPMADGSFELTYTIFISNARREPIVNVQVKEDLTRTFPSPLGFSVLDAKASGGLVMAVGFDGRSNVNVLQTGSVLQGMARDSVVLRVRVVPNGFSGQVSNIVDGYAQAKWFNVERQSIDTSKSAGRRHGAGLSTSVLLPEVKILIPDVITPNGDGFNDRFTIQRPSHVKVGLMIFNNRGVMVYKTDDYKNTWNGTASTGNQGNLLPSGTYFYVAEFTGDDISGREVRKGYLTLKRE